MSLDLKQCHGRAWQGEKWMADVDAGDSDYHYTPWKVHLTSFPPYFDVVRGCQGVRYKGRSRWEEGDVRYVET
jgi:hypothetical protein